MLVRRLRWLSIVLLILSEVAFSQTSSTSLQGTVTDSGGAAIPDASVPQRPAVRRWRSAPRPYAGSFEPRGKREVEPEERR